LPAVTGRCRWQASSQIPYSNLKGDTSAMTRNFLNRRLALAGVALVGSVLLAAGCGNSGGGHDMGNMGGGAMSASAGSNANASFNDADVMFAQMMIPHHKQAVEMATLADTQATDPQLKQLAAQIKSAQDPEITKMTGWLQAWGKPTTAPSGHSMGGASSMPGMGGGMPGMMSDADMTKLKAAKGKDFDRQFATMMIGHHNGAIQMARDEQTNGSSADAKALAKNIADSQQTEVATLQKILDRL
jgi:uncharacterized protein (DUF305 family)